MGITKPQLALYSLGHFFMDFSCALLLFSRMYGEPSWALCVLLYNFCAFALQMPLGLITDRLDRNSCAASLGCALAALGWAFPVAPVFAAALAGVGNALFHVGAGVDVLNISESRATALGLFVAPGGLGVFVGTLPGKAGAPSPFLPVLGLIFFGLLFICLDICLRGALKSHNSPCCLDITKDGALSLVFMFLAMLLYSFVSASSVFPWKAGAPALLCALAAFFGKIVCGALSCAFGMKRTAAVSLGAAAVFLFFGALPITGILSMFLLHSALIILLFSAAKVMPGAKGFSYGILKFALFLGFLPAAGGQLYGANLSLCALTVLSALVLLMPGLKKGKIK